MGVHVHGGTIPGGLTPICNDCGVALCWDISGEDYKQDWLFWEDWRCRTCNPDYEGALKRFRESQEANPTRVINIRDSKGTPNEVYIGRAGKNSDGYFGNPISKGKKCPVCGNIHIDGGSTLSCYREWLAKKLETDPVFKERVKGLYGRTLVCFCNPDPCHGDVLAATAATLVAGDVQSRRKSLIYAGIGSRETPVVVQETMTKIAAYLASLGWVLRSGGAEGADTAFEKGCDEGKGKKEIYLPKKGFNNNPSPLYEISFRAMGIAKQFHPQGDRLDGYNLKLMARNCYQVLGQNLETPSDFIVCWTADGGPSGGTGQALRMAKHYGITVFNLFDPNNPDKPNPKVLEKLKEFIRKHK